MDKREDRMKRKHKRRIFSRVIKHFFCITYSFFSRRMEKRKGYSSYTILRNTHFVSVGVFKGFLKDKKAEGLNMDTR